MSIENKVTQGKEMRTSSMFLIIVGGALTVFFALEYFKITNVFTNLNKLPLLIISAFFLIMGILSLASAKRTVNKGKKEAQLVSDISDWFSKKYDSEKIDSMIDTNECDENDLFYLRIDKISSLMTEKFPEIEEKLASDLSEELYNTIFENNI